MVSRYSEPSNGMLGFSCIFHSMVAFAFCQNIFSWPAVCKQHTAQSSTKSQRSPSHTTHSLGVEKCWTSWHSWHSWRINGVKWCVLHEWPLKAFAFPGQKSLPARSSETEHRRLQGSPSCQGRRPSHLEALRQVASSAGHWWAHNTFPTKLTVTFNSTWRRTRHFLDLRG